MPLRTLGRNIELYVPLHRQVSAVLRNSTDSSNSSLFQPEANLRQPTPTESMSASLKLADDQRFALMKLRRNVQDILQPHHDDHFLLRWLKARKWDPAAAEKMLRNSLEWRKQWSVDKLDEWDEPRVLKDYLPHGLTGFDKEGSPVVVILFGAFDLYGILHVVSRKEMVKVTIKHLEAYLKVCGEQAKKHGPAASQVTVIFDMQDFNLRQYMWRPAGETVIALIQLYEAHYPEILKVCYIVNAPRVFALAFSVAKKFLDDYTISKIQIYKADPVKWQQAILKTIPKEQLPAHFGGTLTDPDGNPKYTTKVHPGGKIPKEMYVDDLEKGTDAENYTVVTIRKGDKLKIDLPTSESGALLSWEFRTEGHDIKFGIERHEANGSCTEVVPFRKVQPDDIDEIGILTCDVPATYSVIFDNSYSLWRSKKLRYSLRMVPPTEAFAGIKESIS